MRYWQRDSLKRKFRLGLVNCEGDGDAGGGGGSNGNDGGAGNWVETIPEPIREWDEVKNSDSSEKFWDQMANMRSRLGQSIRVPGKDAGKEDLEKFYEKLSSKVPGLMRAPNPENEEELGELYNRLGRPEKEDGYALPEIKDANGNIIEHDKLDMSFVSTLKPIAHKLGLNQKQFGTLVKAATENNISKHLERVDAISKDHETLKTDWGAAYDQNMKIVEVFLTKADAPEGIVKALSKGLLDSKSTKWFHTLATQSLGDGKSFINDENVSKGVMTPDEAAMKISEIRNNKEHPYNNKNDPGHKAALKYVRELYLLKNPKSGSAPAPGTVFSVGGAA